VVNVDDTAELIGIIAWEPRVFAEQENVPDFSGDMNFP